MAYNKTISKTISFKTQNLDSAFFPCLQSAKVGLKLPIARSVQGNAWNWSNVHI